MTKEEDFLPNFLLKTEFEEGVSLQDVYNYIFSDDEIMVKKRKYKNFWAYLRNVLKDKDFEMNETNPKAPLFYKDGNISSSSSDKNNEIFDIPLIESSRNCVYQHFVIITLFSKFVQVKEKHRFFWINKNSFVMESETNSKGFPFADTFYMIIKYFYY